MQIYLNNNIIYILYSKRHIMYYINNHKDSFHIFTSNINLSPFNQGTSCFTSPSTSAATLAKSLKAARGRGGWSRTDFPPSHVKRRLLQKHQVFFLTQKQRFKFQYSCIMLLCSKSSMSQMRPKKVSSFHGLEGPMTKYR